MTRCSESISLQAKPQPGFANVISDHGKGGGGLLHPEMMQGHQARCPDLSAHHDGIISPAVSHPQLHHHHRLPAELPRDEDVTPNFLLVMHCQVITYL